jgi:hypothetical protein
MSGFDVYDWIAVAVAVAWTLFCIVFALWPYEQDKAINRIDLFSEN